MSSNSQRSSRRATAASSRNQTTTTAPGVELNTTATRRATRTAVQAVRSDKKTYFVDSDDEDDVVLETKPSPSKRSKPVTNGMLNGKSSSGHMNGHSKLNPEMIAQLESITGLGRSEATELLEACEHSLEKAVEIHFGGGSVGETSKPSGSGRGTSGARPANKRVHKEIDDAIAISDDSNSQCSSKYDEDGVRAPIAPTFARLCDYDPYAVNEFQSHAKRSRVDGFRNMREEFNEGLATGSSRRKNFSTLFRPPIDLLFDGSFEASKVRACHVNKWVLLNVQSHDDFTSKCLNRDLWSDEMVKEIIKANFVFNQVYHDSGEGQKIINIYNIHAYPFIGIIDPRTGEKLIELQANKIDSCSFLEKITSFLCDFEMPNGDVDTNIPSNECVKIDDEDEIVEVKNAGAGASGGSSKRTAQDILNNDVLVFESDDDADDIKDGNDSYEDDAVISKDKYMKQKSSSVKPASSSIETSTTTTTTSAIANGLPKPVEASATKASVCQEPEKPYQPRVIKYETPDSEKKDCSLRVSYPNGDRLDFSTNGNCKIKYLTEYLIKDGFRLDTHELIERLMPTFMKPKPQEEGSILDITEQSRNLFHKDPNLTFKQLNLYPRVALLLQET